ncbi:MAG TPA: glycosyltransferase family 39 protein [Alphaproteobacteria bacterium]|nr:glycosyltransferase family 39 protein [Alphaproteobacteria bacterium]
MHITAASRAVSNPNPVALSWLAAGAVTVLLVLKLQLIFLQNINWDEFFFLSMVHSALRGDLAIALQTVHVHAFYWLPQVSVSEVDQVVAARGVMFALQVGTCGFIYLVGRRLFGPAAAVFGGLAYLTLSYTVDHGTSFRADPIAAFLLMAALWMIVRDRSGMAEVVAAGLLTAVAGLVTIKSIFYVPTLVLAVLCLTQAQRAQRRVVELIVLGLTALAAFGLFYIAHGASLDGAKNIHAANLVAVSSAKMIQLDNLFPRSPYLLNSMFGDPAVWILLLGGFAAAVATAASGARRQRGFGLVGLGLPLLTFIFYRNAFPYFYVFVLAAPAVLAAGMFDRFARSHGQNRKFHWVVAMTMVVLAMNPIGRYLRNDVDRTAAQRQHIDVVHRMFPRPVAYIDRSSMVASFPKVGFFMSTWGMESYLAAGRPIMRGLLTRHHPVFVLANIDSLRLDAPRVQVAGTKRYRLLPADHAVLRENFVHHWGAIWVAGKHLTASVLGQVYQFEILIPGSYTVESAVPVMIDGVARRPGAKVMLDAGRHTLVSQTAPARIVLRWGTDLYRPAETPISTQLFVGFAVPKK